jgi:hypothetical protein
MYSFTSLAKYFIVAVIILMLSGFSLWHNPKRDRFLIPDKFTGTVYVYFQVPGAPTLKMEDGYRLIIVPDSGVVKTSSDLIPGKLHDEYWLYSCEKRIRMSPYKLGGGGTVKQKNALGQQEIYFQFEVLKEERSHDTLWSILTKW